MSDSGQQNSVMRQASYRPLGEGLRGFEALQAYVAGTGLLKDSPAPRCNLPSLAS